MIKKQYKSVFVTVGTTEFVALVRAVTSTAVLEQLAKLGCTALTIQFGKGEAPDVELAQRHTTIRLFDFLIFRQITLNGGFAPPSCK